MHQSADDLDIMHQHLKEGKIILCPTDTIWGLSCNAFDEKAVERIFRIKQRSEDKKFILIVSSIEQLKIYIRSLHPRIETLVHYCERPLTVIYRASPTLPDHLVCSDGTVAIRVTKNPLLCELASTLGNPIVSTSANIQGRPEPSNFMEIEHPVIEQTDYISKLNRNSNSNRRSSVIIRYNEEGELFFLR